MRAPHSVRAFPITPAPYSLRRLYFLDRQPILPCRRVNQGQASSSDTSIVSHRCVCMQYHPIGPATLRPRLRNPHLLQNPLQRSSEQSLLGLGSVESTLRGIGTMRGLPQGSCLIMGSPRRSTDHKSCVFISDQKKTADEAGGRGRKKNLLPKYGICDSVELEAGKCTARFEHPVRLAQDIRDGGNVPDPKRNGVKIICIIREDFQRQCLGICFNKRNLRRCKGLSSAQGTGKNNTPREARAHCCDTSSF